MGIFRGFPVLRTSRPWFDVANVNLAVFIGPAIELGFLFGGLWRIRLSLNFIRFSAASIFGEYGIGENYIRQF